MAPNQLTVTSDVDVWVVLDPSPLLLPPDLLHKRIGDAIEAMTESHQHIGAQQFIHNRLNLLHSHLAADRFPIGGLWDAVLARAAGAECRAL